MTPFAENETRLNGICPYFARFPLQFPLDRMGGAVPGQWALDPFCGSGTVVFAARLLGMGAIAIDNNPAAAAIARAKLHHVSAGAVAQRAMQILDMPAPDDMPAGPFWTGCFTPRVLAALCRFRAYLSQSGDTPADIMLRALLLGVLHGSKGTTPGFLSNHLPADFAPAPETALAFWHGHDLAPPECDVMALIRERVRHVLAMQPAAAPGAVYQGDCRVIDLTAHAGRCDWVITSPPYYGMNSYTTDQWIRNWLLGGPATPCAEDSPETPPTYPGAYVAELARAWANCARACKPGARLVARVGDVPGVVAPPGHELLAASLRAAHVGWRITTRRAARTLERTKRIRPDFMPPAPWPENEMEVFARYEP